MIIQWSNLEYLLAKMTAYTKLHITMQQSFFAQLEKSWKLMLILDYNVHAKIELYNTFVF